MDRDRELFNEGKWTWINKISTSHELATALLDRNNSAVTATLNEEEYVIESIQKVFNHANVDDNVSHWTLNLRDGGKGNIKR